MNGHEHYAEAERLAAAYKDAIGEVEKLPAKTADQRLEMHLRATLATALLTKAQVHATLALAAATSDGHKAANLLARRAVR